MRDRRYIEDLSIKELEEALIIRRREERLARMRRMGAAKQRQRTVIVAEGETALGLSAPGAGPVSGFLVDDRLVDGRPSAESDQVGAKTPLQVWRDRVLLGVEGAALLGLVVVIASLILTLRNLNQDWRKGQAAQAQPVPTATPLIRAAVLPGGHKPPTLGGGEAQPLGPSLQLTIPTPGPRSPTRLAIPSIHVDVPVVEGDDWEQLKRGAGHHIGSANPGERGNCFISGHNDVYGEIFRALPEVKVGDEIIVYATEQSYRYTVRATRIVEPDDVSVMYPTSAPILTLMTCYPYMIDTQRFVVISELATGWNGG